MFAVDAFLVGDLGGVRHQRIPFISPESGSDVDLKLGVCDELRGKLRLNSSHALYGVAAGDEFAKKFVQGPLAERMNLSGEPTKAGGGNGAPRPGDGRRGIALKDDER